MPAAQLQLDRNLIGRDLTIDQHDQVVGFQYNAAGDIHIYAQATLHPGAPDMLAAQRLSRQHDTSQEIRTGNNKPGQACIAGERPWDATDIFQGRSHEREALGQLLAEGRARVVSILGRGGMGKTALACTVLRGLEQSHWPQSGGGPPVDGIAYLSTRTSGVTLERLFLGGMELLGSDRRERLKTVQASRDFTVEEKIARLLEAFEQGLYVMLLDNLEDLIDAEGCLTDSELAAFFHAVLLHKPHGLRLLVTSRVPLRLDLEAKRRDLAGRHRYVTLSEGLSVAEGVQLLRELDPNGEWGVSAAPEETLAVVVRRTHGMPRALELVVSILDKNMDATLDEVARDFYSQAEVVQKLVEENYRLLHVEARQVVEALAVYSRPVSQVALDFLLQPFAPGLAVPIVLDRLVRSHVVQYNREAKMATLHPIDQEYLYQRIPGEGVYSQPALHAQAAEYYHSQRLVEPDGHFGFTSRSDFNTLGPQLSEFDHQVKAGRFESAGELLAEFGPALAFTGLASYCREMTRTVAGQVRGDRARLGVLACEMALQIQLGPVSEALGVGEQAREVANRLNSPKEESAIEGLLGQACRYMGDGNRAITHFERALELDRGCNRGAHESNYPEVHEGLEGSLSLCYSYVGNVRQALHSGHQLLALAERSEDPYTRVRAHNALSLAYFTWGQWEEAIRHSTAALTVWQSGMDDRKAYILNTLGMALFLVGRYPDAVAALRAGRDAAVELESPRAKGFCLCNLAFVHYLGGTPAQALPVAVEAQSLVAAAGLAEQGISVLGLLDAAASNDRAAEARALLNAAKRLTGHPDLFPARNLAARARDLAAELGLDDLAGQAQQCLDDCTARLVLPDE